jgi:hypothetical protein
MAEKGSSEQRGGILMRGASGHLFFMRDGDDEPRRLSDAVAAELTGALEREPPGELLSFPASERVREALEREVGELPFWGVIIWWGRRLRR